MECEKTKRQCEGKQTQNVLNNKYYQFQLEDNCSQGMSGKELDIRFAVAAGLTMEQAEKLEEAIIDKIEEYNEIHAGDFSEIRYYDILEKAADAQGITIEYPKVDYTIRI